MLVQLCFLALLFIVSGLGSAPSGPWNKFNYAPASRVVRPAAIKKRVGEVKHAANLVKASGSATLGGNQSWVTLDFGIEVGGLISLNFHNVQKASGLALSFTESPMFINPRFSDDSSGSAINMSYDGVLNVLVAKPLANGFWTQPAPTLRGGFRYLTLVSTGDAPVTISNVSCEINFSPHIENLRDYNGYFYASDPVFHDKDFLTKIWYAGAYTVQTNTIPVHSGRQAHRSPGWLNNATGGVAGPIIVDGAKRDRTVWPGDMGVAVPTQFVSTNDLIPTRNSLSTMFAAMNPTTGALPYSGPPLSFLNSDTYHMWTLIGTHNYVLYSGDVDWLRTVWTNYTRAVAFVEGKVDGSGLMNVTGVDDWGRLGGGGHSAEANALLYRVLMTSADLANWLNETALASNYLINTTALKTRFNEIFWLPSAGMFRDNETTTLCPQDANSIAILYNLTTSAEQANSISKGLTRNWNEIGAVSPELPDTIAPFVGSFELQAHFESGNDERAMDLLRRQWGYMLYTNLSVQSTLLEGYTANGSLGYRSYRGYNYDASYTSHAHGWSTGPTSALTYYVLGLQVTGMQGRTWSLAPHTSGLSSAEGGFTTSLGWFGAQWSLSKTELKLSVEAPAGTRGTVRLPLSGKMTVNEKNAKAEAGGTIELQGGKKHNIVVRR